MISTLHEMWCLHHCHLVGIRSLPSDPLTVPKCSSSATHFNLAPHSSHSTAVNDIVILLSFMTGTRPKDHSNDSGTGSSSHSWTLNLALRHFCRPSPSVGWLMQSLGPPSPFILSNLVMATVLMVTGAWSIAIDATRPSQSLNLSNWNSEPLTIGHFKIRVRTAHVLYSVSEISRVRDDIQLSQSLASVVHSSSDGGICL